jgi:hypothetical protein
MENCRPPPRPVGSFCCQLAKLIMTRMACPLRSTDVTPLHRRYGTVRPCPAYRYFRPRGATACAFSLTTSEQVLKFHTRRLESRHLYPGHPMASNQVSATLFPESGGAPVLMPPVDLFRGLMRGSLAFVLPSLHMPLSNASSAASRSCSHGSGSGWFAIPFLYGSCIHYFTPVYPDAIHAKSVRHRCGCRCRNRTGRPAAWNE